jgi:hypothetical protein
LRLAFIIISSYQTLNYLPPANWSKSATDQK